MNLSNEKNALLNTVSRLAVDVGARVSAKFVTRSAMTAAALTVATFALSDSNPAIAACSIATATADGGPGGVICGTGVAGGFDSDGYDSITLVVSPDGVASAANGLVFDPGAGEANDSDGNTIIILNTELGGTNAGQVTGTAGDGIKIQGSNNTVSNGGGTTIGGGSIKGTDDGIEIVSGSGNTINNVANGNGGTTTAGEIAGGDNGIVINGSGTNVINNGLSGSGTATVKGGDDGITLDGTGTLTVNNGAKGSIKGDGSDGIEVSGDSTLNLVNAGAVSGAANGLKIDGANADVNLSGTGGTVTGATNGVNITDDGVTFTMSGTNTVVANGGNGINIVNDGGDSATGATLNLNGGTIKATGDGVFVDSGETGATINVDGVSIGTSGVRVGDDGIDLNETASVNVKSGSIYATGWGIEINDSDASASDINVGNSVGGAGTALVDGTAGGILVSNGVDDTGIDVATDGTVQSVNGPGIQINESNGSGENNDVLVEGIVKSTNGTGILVNGQNATGGDNDVTVETGGLVEGGTTGVNFAGNGDGTDANGDNLDNSGTIKGGTTGVLVSNHRSDIGNNNGGVIESVNGDGVRFDTLHIDGDSTESGYQDDETAVINAGTDGIVYSGGINGGSGLEGDAQEVVIVNGTVNAGDDGIEVNGKFDVTNNGKLYSTSTSTASSNGIELNGSDNNATNDGEIKQEKGGDGIHADVDNQLLITNTASIIATGGEDADGISLLSGNAIDYLTGGGVEQKAQNVGEDASIVADDNGIEVVNYTVVLNGEDATITGDADEDGKGAGISVGSGNTVKNDGTILGGNDGIQVNGTENEGLFGGITNSATGNIDVKGSGIAVLGDENDIFNAGNIKGGVYGVELSGDDNEFYSTGGAIKGGTGAAIYSDDDNEITITGGTISTTGEDGGSGIHLEGDNNEVNVSNGVDVTGDLNGLKIEGDLNDVDVDDEGDVTGTTGNGIAIIGGNTNDIDVDGNVSGGEDGIGLVNASNNNIDVGGNVTGTNGDGVDIFGGGTNTVTVGGDIVGDPGVIITNSDNNNVSATNIKGKLDGVQINNGDSNIVKASADIVGDSDGNGSGIGVNIGKGSSLNEVSAGDDITGYDAVSIAGNDNIVSADDNIRGEDDGVIISGNGNAVTAGNNIVGTDGDGLSISGNNNEVGAEGNIEGDDVGIDIEGDDNDVTVGDSVEATDGDGVHIDGNDNTVDVENEISASGDGLVLHGDDNKVSADSIDADGNGIVIDADDNDVEIGSQIDAGLNGVWIQGGSGNSVNLEGVLINAGEDGIKLDNSDNEVETDADTTINAGDDGIELNYGGTKNNIEEFTWNGTINADDDGIVATEGYMSIINNGTINADVDDDNDGDGIAVGSDSFVENSGSGEITGWNGITGEDKNVVVNDGDINVENNGIQLGDENDVENNGTITAGEDGINVGDDNKVINDGTITAGDDGIDAGDKNYIENNSALTIIADENGIEAGSDNKILNTGIIVADANDDNDGDGIFAEDKNEITNEGSISGWNGIVADDSNVIVNASGATIDAENNGIVVDDDNNADGATSGEDNEYGVTNAGTIDAGNIGVSLDTNNDFLNTGDINATNFGVVANSSNLVVNSASGTIDGNIGVSLGASNTLTNQGVITGVTDGVITTSSSNVITNSKTITGTNDDGVSIVGSFNKVDNNSGATITGKDDGVDIDGSTNTVNNSGTITGTLGDGIEVLTGSANQITNNNLIQGGDDGVDFNTGGNYLYNYSQVKGANDGVEVSGSSNQVNNFGGTITGTSDDGIDIDGNSTYVYNSGTVVGNDEGIEIDSSSNTVSNYGTIKGTGGDGIDINSGGNNEVYNYGSITGLWQGIDNEAGDLYVYNSEGTIQGTNSAGIESNVGNDDYDTSVYNYSYPVGESYDEGLIIGKTDGIHVGGEGFYLTNGIGSTIQGTLGSGIHTDAEENVITNYGTIIGKVTGITDGDTGGYSTTYIDNTGTITGSEAGYLYEDESYGGVVQIDNKAGGVISATGPGVLPTPVVDEEEGTVVDLDMINGEDANPVAAIDTSAGPADLSVFIFNWGTIQGANDFSVAVDDLPETEEDESEPSVQLTNRFAVLGGDGEEYVVNFAGGVINGDIALQSGNDILALEIGSTLNGDADLGQTIGTEGVLGFIPDDEETEEDESAGGTAIGFVPTAETDSGIDVVVLFGTGYQDLSSDITEAEILFVDDQLTKDFIYPGNIANAIAPTVPNQPLPAGTWTLNGNVTIDGTNLFEEVDIDTDGDGITDDSEVILTGTVATIVDNGRLNVGGTTITEIPGVPTDEEEGELTDSTFKVDVIKSAVLTSPVVDVLSGGTLGGHGTIYTNPGANGGNGGVNLTGLVEGPDVTLTGGLNPGNTLTSPALLSEARGSLIVGTGPGDFVTQGEDGTITANVPDGEDDFKFVTDDEDEEADPVKVDLAYTKDASGKLYPDITLPANFVSEDFSGPFDFTTDSPRYATLAPGDEMTRIGTLTVYGNVTMDAKVTGTTQYKIAMVDDPATEGKDESKDEEGNQAYKFQTARTVVTNWGSQFQADLKDDGTNDLLLVKKTGVTKAFTASTFDDVGPGVADLVTQDDEGTIIDDEADGTNDYEIVAGEGDDPDTKVDILYDGEGGPDKVADGVAYKVSTVLDGHASVNGRLDIRLDGEFVDLVNNSEEPLIDDPDGPTGCGDDPDGADSCPQVKNPAYAIPDGIADVDDKGIAKNNADFSNKAYIWDVIIAEGGVSGKFQDLGFDGGPNDGAVVTRYASVTVDDPNTPDVDEGGVVIPEVRVPLLKAYLVYLPDRVRIVSIPEFGSLPNLDLTLNQQQTADYLDTLTKFGMQEDSLQGLIAIVGTSTDIPAALDALHPEWYNAFNEVGFSIARGAEQQAYIRTIEAQGFSGGSQNRVVMNVGDDSAVGSSASDKRATFWLAGSWGNANIDDGREEGWLEYKYETLTGYAGFDYLINPNLLLGVLGGFSNSDVDAKNGTKEGDVDSWQVGGYISYFTESWFLNAGGGIGDMNIESIRNIAFGGPLGSVSQVANAKYDGDIMYFYGKGGYSFDLGNSGWKLSPELAMSYVKVKQDAFSEFGPNTTPLPGLNGDDLLLDVEGQSVKSLRGTAQVRLSKTFLSGNGGGWMPYVRAGVANEFEDDLRPIVSRFQGAPANSASFTVFGQVPRQTTIIFGAGVTGKVSESFSLYLDYSGEIGGSFSEHVISGGARFHF